MHAQADNLDRYSCAPVAAQSKKRKLDDVVAAKRSVCLDHTVSPERHRKPSSTPTSTKKSIGPRSPQGSNEKRLKRYRKQAPQSYMQKLYRAQTHR